MSIDHDTSYIPHYTTGYTYTDNTTYPYAVGSYTYPTFTIPDYATPSDYLTPPSPPWTPDSTVTTTSVYDHLAMRNRAMEEEIASLEEYTEELELIIDKLLEEGCTLDSNSQDEEVHLRTEEGHQGTDERGSSARSRKGDWYWPSS